jgi:hypothetical protein
MLSSLGGNSPTTIAIIPITQKSSIETKSEVRIAPPEADITG